MSDGNSAAASLVSVLAVLGALVLFCALFTAFLLVPLFVFIAAIVALIFSEWNRDRNSEEPVASETGGADK